MIPYPFLNTAGHGPSPGVVIAGLRERGHDVSVDETWRSAAGPVSHIEVADDAVVGVADPRVSTTAALHT